MESFLRPEAIVLGENATVPGKNIISPAPNQFTHELTRSQPFFFDVAEQPTQPSGQFPIDTKVVLLLYEGGKYCRVADYQGLYVDIEFDSLKRI